MRSTPVAHFGLKEDRARSHHSGVVGQRESKGEGVSVGRMGIWSVVRGVVLELTVAKWELRRFAMDVESELNDDHLLVGVDEVDEVASLRVFQIAEGLCFLLSRRWK
jgi:hypothetical protein